MLKYLRIAVTALSLTACLLLSALWVRSYSRVEYLDVLVSSTRSATFHSGLGNLAVDSTFDPDAAFNFPPDRSWRYRCYPGQRIIDVVIRVDARGAYPPQPNFGVRRLNGGRSHLFVRHWIPVLITGVLAAMMGIRRPFRFSLRALLIATTLVAVGLGIVAISR